MCVLVAFLVATTKATQEELIFTRNLRVQCDHMVGKSWKEQETVAHSGSEVRKQRDEQRSSMHFRLLTQIFQTPSTMG